MRNSVLIVVLLFISKVLSAQVNSPFIFNDSVVKADSNQVKLILETRGFFKNNEYFNDFIEGYTLPGISAKPRLSLQLGTNTRLEGGIYLNKFAGDTFPVQTGLVFSIRQSLNPWLDITLGELGNPLDHALPEPFYHFDDHYFQPLEYGLSFESHHQRYKGELWLSWEQFIRKGDAFREYFTVGNSGYFPLLKTGNHTIELPLYFQFRHKGGQINQTDTSMQTLHNNASGLRYNYRFSDWKHEGKVGAQYLQVLYIDMSPSKVMEYDRGIGFYPSLFVEYSIFRLHAEYWEGINYLPVREYTLYSAMSTHNPAVLGDYRKMMNLKFDICKEYKHSVRFILRLETFQDLTRNTFDYTYGFHLVANPEVLLKRIK